ncbi:MAG: HRDC domain-containing protein [Candidatus Geothermincolia bacterium]
MRCRTLGIRVEQPYAAIDEDAADRFMESVSVRKVTASLCDMPDPSWSVLVFYDERPASVRSPRGATEIVADPAVEAPEGDGAPATVPGPAELRLVEELKSWRAARAAREGLPQYCVAQNRSLEEIARVRPATQDALAGVKGFGPTRVEKYGPEIISLVTSGNVSG